MPPMTVRIIESEKDRGPDTIALHGESLQISFRRTIRVPDRSNTDYSDLPPDFGPFPLISVAQFASRLPEAIAKKKGVFLPMHQEEAMWIRFKSEMQFAIKVYVGSVNAVSGEPAEETEETQLRRYRRMQARETVQDYMVTPKQKWLDGIATTAGSVRQFVAVRTGDGYTVEAQVTGRETVAGVAFEVTRKKYVFDKHINILCDREQIGSVEADQDMLVQEFIKLVEDATGMSLTKSSIWTRPNSIADWVSLKEKDERDDPLEEDYTRPIRHYYLGGRKAATISVGQIGQAVQNEDKVRVSVLDMTGKRHELLVDLDTAPEVLHPLVSALTNIPEDQMRLVFDGRQLNTGLVKGSLRTIGIKQDSTIHLCNRLRGGASKGWYGAFDMDETTSRFGEMGIAAGGLIKQYIQQDHYPRNTWDPSTTTVVNVQILTVPLFERVTGIAAPPCPISAETYIEHGFSFFDIPESASTISGNFDDIKSLAALKTLRDLFLEQDGDIEDDPVGPKIGFRTVSDIEDRMCTDFPLLRQIGRPNPSARRVHQPQAAASTSGSGSSGKSTHWRCTCGHFMEHQWWTCSQCGKMKTSSKS